MAEVECLSNSVSRSKKPILEISKAYYGKDKSPCTETDFRGQHWYHGTGLPPKEHPGMDMLRVLERDLPLSKCGYCNGTNVLVIALQGCVHPMSGDAYYDYEVVCTDCGGFTTYAYAEN